MTVTDSDEAKDNKLFGILMGILDKEEAEIAQVQKPFLEILDRFAKKAVEDFPELEDKLFLYDLSTGTAHNGFDKDDDLRNYAKNLKRNNPDFVAFASRSADCFQIVYMEPFEYGRTVREGKMSRELEHELAHIVFHWGLEKEEYRSIFFKRLMNVVLHRGRNFEENQADVFSFIRQRQQYQNNENLLEEQIFKRSVSLIINGETDHFTLPVLKEFDRLSQSNDLSKLTPVQTGNLSYRLSLQYALADDQLRKLAKIFAPFRKEYNKNGKELSEPVFRKCAEIMFEDNGELSQMAFTSGKTFLAPFLNNDKKLMSSWMSSENIPTFVLEENFWNDVRAKIEERETQKKTPKQIRTSEAIDMQMFGFFDKDPDSKINPKEYRSKKNLAYLKQQREAFIKGNVLKQGTVPSMPSLC